MRPIFVSYRRDDTEGEAGRLFDDLVSRFGEDSVFLDVAAIEVGRDFRKAIDESVGTCGVLLAVIGKNWVDAKNEAGDRRLDDPFDFVRIETASALKRDIPVIPVLVHGAKMPRADQLPEDLRELTYRNGVELTHARWRSDLELLIKALSPFADPKPTAPAPAPMPPGEPEKKVSAGRGSNSGRAFTVQVLGAVVLAAGAFWFWSTQRTVPDLTGSTLAEAKLKLEAASLAVGNKAYQPDSEKAPDTVLSQAPLPNARVKSGTAVDLVVVKQASLVEVPRLRGRSLDEAKQALEGLHLTVGRVSQEPNSSVAANTVLSEFPSSGRKVDSGTAIDMVVAQAAPPPGPPLPQKDSGAGSIVSQPSKGSGFFPPSGPSLPPKGPVAGPIVSQPPKGSGSLPNFAGTWQLFAITEAGATKSVPAGLPFVITQDGATVTENNRVYQISPSGTFGYKNFFAAKHQVKTADEADRVQTLTWRVEGSTLVFESTYDYKNPSDSHLYPNEPRILHYRRVAP